MPKTRRAGAHAEPTTKRGRSRKETTLGEDLIESMQEIIAIKRAQRRGEDPGVRVERHQVTARHATATPAPVYTGKDIAKVRAQLHLSQSVFAAALNVSPETVKAWEQGKRKPDGTAHRLIQIIREHPEYVLSKVIYTDALGA